MYLFYVQLLIFRNIEGKKAMITNAILKLDSNANWVGPSRCRGISHVAASVCIFLSTYFVSRANTASSCESHREVTDAVPATSYYECLLMSDKRTHRNYARNSLNLTFLLRYTGRACSLR